MAPFYKLDRPTLEERLPSSFGQLDSLLGVETADEHFGAAFRLPCLAGVDEHQLFAKICAWALEALQDLQAEAMADDLPIDLERMRLWSKEEAAEYFESGGQVDPGMPSDDALRGGAYERDWAHWMSPLEPLGRGGPLLCGEALGIPVVGVGWATPSFLTVQNELPWSLEPNCGSIHSREEVYGSLPTLLANFGVRLFSFFTLRLGSVVNNTLSPWAAARYGVDGALWVGAAACVVSSACAVSIDALERITSSRRSRPPTESSRTAHATLRPKGSSHSPPEVESSIDAFLAEDPVDDAASCLGERTLAEAEVNIDTLKADTERCAAGAAPLTKDIPT